MAPLNYWKQKYTHDNHTHLVRAHAEQAFTHLARYEPRYRDVIQRKEKRKEARDNKGDFHKSEEPNPKSRKGYWVLKRVPGGWVGGASLAYH